MSKKSEAKYLANFEKVFIGVSLVATLVLGLWVYSFVMLFVEFTKALQ